MALWHKNLNELTDIELLARYREQKDKRCIGVLSQRYSHLMYGVCLSYLKSEEDARDAVMDIFEKMFEKLLTHEVQNFKSWLFSVCKNHCLMSLRKKSSTMKKEEGYFHVVGDNVDNEDILHLVGENDEEVNYELLGAALKELKPEQKKCVELFYLEEKSYKEVAELTGYDLKKVKSYIQNGKRNLKIYLEKYNGKTA